MTRITGLIAAARDEAARGPGARAYPGGLAGRGIVDMGRDPDGVLRLRLPPG